MVYVSVRGRIWLQAEAMNMVESVGNYVKHRRIPVIVKEENKYITFFVPSISGESVAHAYQMLLAEELKKLQGKVCKYCERGIFLKSTTEYIYNEIIKNNNINNSQSKSEEKSKEKSKSNKNEDEEKENMEKIEEVESNIVKNCGVEDIGGFLYTGKPNIKRTSSFLTGYVIPVREALKVISIDPQLHSRYALGTYHAFGKKEEEKTAGQMIYYVELSSAVFSFPFDLDTKYIGKYTFHVEKYGKEIVDKQEMDKRVKAALEALKRFLIEFPVGAKRTRFNPSDLRWESIAIAVSDDVWTMPSSFTLDYLQRAMKKKEKISYNTVIHAYAEENCHADKCYGTAEEAVIASICDALERYEKGSCEKS